MDKSCIFPSSKCDLASVRPCAGQVKCPVSVRSVRAASKTPTRNKRTVNKDEAVDEVPVAPASAAKRPRRSTRDSTAATTVAASVPADKMKNGQEQENQDIKLTMTRSKKISARSSVRASILDKDMMDNPFAKKATVRKLPYRAILYSEVGMISRVFGCSV